MKVWPLPLVLGSLLAATPAPGQEPVETFRQEGANPSLGVETVAVPGETVYEEHDVLMIRRQVAIPEGDLVYSRKRTVPAGATLRGTRGPRGSLYYCSSVRVSEVFGGGYICAADLDGDGKLETFKTTSAPRKKAVDPPVAFEAKVQEVELDPADGIVSADLIDSFRRELILQGTAGGILRLAYREFSGDMIRPAFQQDLTYDFEPEGTTKVAFRKVRIEVLSAGNDGLRYRILSGF